MPRHKLTNPHAASLAGSWERVPRPPRPSSEKVSRVMRANRASSTGPELLLRRALWSAGVRGYHLNSPDLAGRPDIIYPRRRLAVFVHGCFWHRCPKHGRTLPKSNQGYWRLKFRLNVQRDSAKTQQLESMGWKVLIVWECELRADPLRQVRLIRRAISVRRQDRSIGLTI
jgi:DNA mismatch endonuclease, patch repair protein